MLLARSGGAASGQTISGTPRLRVEVAVQVERRVAVRVEPFLVLRDRALHDRDVHRRAARVRPVDPRGARPSGHGSSSSDRATPRSRRERARLQQRTSAPGADQQQADSR